MRSTKRWAAAAAAALAVVGLAGCFGDGTHRVGFGKDRVAPGLYTTYVPPGGFCYWARLRSLDPSNIIDNDIATAGRAFVYVGPGDAAIQSDDCGTWAPAGPGSYNPNTSRMTDGEYRVNIEVRAGVYRTSGGSSCYWSRLRSWDGSTWNIADNHFGSGPQIVTIYWYDAGFTTSRCGTWTKIG